MEQFIVTLGIVYFLLIQVGGFILALVSWFVMTKLRIRMWKVKITVAMLLAWPVALPFLMVYAYVHSHLKEGVRQFHDLLDGFDRLTRGGYSD